MTKSKLEAELEASLTELPDWIKELERPMKVAVQHGQAASMLGTMIGILDYCRQHMKEKDWAWAQEEFTRMIKTPPGFR